MPVDVWWFVAGVATVLVALVWRQVQRLRARAHLRQALRDSDPVRRRAAVAVAVEQGLRRHAALLGDRVATETDPGVRSALVTAVLRGSWEPADRRDVLRLRLWAQEEATRSPGSVASAPVESRSPQSPQVPQPRLGGHRRSRSTVDSRTVAFPVHVPADRSRPRSRHAAGRSVTESPTSPIPVVAASTRAVPDVATPTAAIPAVASSPVAIPTPPANAALPVARCPQVDAAPSTATPTPPKARTRPSPTPRTRQPTIDGPTFRPFAVRGHG